MVRSGPASNLNPYKVLDQPFAYLVTAHPLIWDPHVLGSAPPLAICDTKRQIGGSGANTNNLFEFQRKDLH